MKTFPLLGSLGGAALFLAGFLAAAGSARAANNPLSEIDATHFDAKSSDIKTETSADGGTNLASIHDGDYAEYKAFDFDSGVAGFKVRVAANQKGTIEVRLDSPTGPLMGTVNFLPTGGWQSWADATCNVDNSLAGVRDIYLVFHGTGRGALLNVKNFKFLKSTVIAGQGVDLSGRLDDPNDGEIQATHAWGMPETGFTDDFEDGQMSHWKVSGLTVTDHALDGNHSVAHTGADLGLAYTPDVYINKTDTGGDWRTMAEASLASDIEIDSKDARPGIGFSSKDGKQWVYVVLNPANNSVEVHRKLADGTDVVIHDHPSFIQDLAKRIADTASQANVTLTLQTGMKYRLQMDWSPYSDGIIVFLYDDKGKIIANFRSVVDLPAARRPMLICSGGDARFDQVKFDPTLDYWEHKWEWYKQPVLGDDVCNPAVWGKDGKMYMAWRKFGYDNFHGIASSTDGIHWTRINDDTLKCSGDMNVVVNPFGDGLTYLTPGGGKAPWFTSDGSDNFSVWNKASINVGNIFGNSRIQEIVDTKRYPQLSPIQFQGTAYRFIAYTENWGTFPKPHSVVLLSNTLDKWVLADPNPVIPPMDTFWGEKGSAIGSAFPLPDGNLLIADCACTWAGYTGAPEPSNVSAITDGKEPWKVLKLGTLPDVPVSREAVWYQGPNFGTAFYYDKATDTLFFFGGFHDYRIGMMRVRHFLHPEEGGSK